MAKSPAQAGTAGSPATGEPVYLAIGLLRRPHGVRGDIIMDVLTDFPERIRPNTRVFIGEQHEPQTVARVRAHSKGLLIAFKGFDIPETVGRFRNMNVYVKTADRPALPEGEYYHHQLLGINVYDESNKMLGVLTDILYTGANDVFVVTNEGGRELLLPVIADVILNIDLETKAMRVHLLPGLVEGSEEA
jgi:16S rRNA processing protein RimM